MLRFRLRLPIAGLRRSASSLRLRRPLRRHGDVDEVLRLACLSFVGFQSAWDRADLRALASMASAPLFDELRRQLVDRGPGPNHTEVVQLDARLLDTEELGQAFVASVEFSGLIRERPQDPAAPFRELWLLAKPKMAGTGWQLAQVQSLS